MALLRHIRRLQYIDFMISRKATGSLDNLAKKNGLGRRAMASVIQDMRELGFPIKFDRFRNTYYYESKIDTSLNSFTIGWDLISRKEAAAIGNVGELCFSEEEVFKPCKK